MRVLYLIPGMSGTGGAEHSLAAMIPFLEPVVDMHIVTWTGRDDLRPEIESAGASLTNLAADSRPAIVREFRRLMIRTKPDLVHTTLIDADVVGRTVAASGMVPVVSSLVNDNHGVSVLRAGNGRVHKRVLAWSADAASARLVVRFHALTDHVASAMSRRLVVPRSRVEVIPRGRDPQRLGRRTLDRRHAAREALGIGDGDPLVIATARHEHQKGLDVLIRAVPMIAQHHSSVRVLLGGREGQSSPELRRLVMELGIADVVEFIGQRSDVAELMCAADVWCVPSRWEGLGSILIEAMGLEVPVVASSLPAVREVAGHPPVFNLVRPEDPGDLARGIIEVLTDPDLAKRRSDHGRDRFVTEFVADEVAQRMMGFYERSLDSSRLVRLRGSGRFR